MDCAGGRQRQAQLLCLQASQCCADAAEVMSAGPGDELHCHRCQQMEWDLVMRAAAPARAGRPPERRCWWWWFATVCVQRRSQGAQLPAG
jgi:hypothetical protein